MITNPFAMLGTYSEGLEEDRARGRPTNEQKEIRNQGKILSDKLTYYNETQGIIASKHTATNAK